jgi:hypothetical protein
VEYHEKIAACAEIIAGKRQSTERIDLHNMHDKFHNFCDDIVKDLARYVLLMTDGKRTVRQAMIYMFAKRIRGSYLYLAVCDVDNPEKVISTLKPDVQLIGIGPYANGFDFPAKALSAAAIERAHQQFRRRVLQQNRTDLAKQQASRHMNTLLTLLNQWLDSTNMPQAKRDEAKGILGRSPTLERIAEACICIGSSLDELQAQYMSA